MANQKYRITEDDYWLAKQWIRKKIQSEEMLQWFDWDTRQALEAEKAFTQVKDETALNAWCDRYLSQQPFSRFQAAIRKGRQRRKEHLARKKQVTLTPTAWNILRTIADKEDIELSEVIETHLKNRYTRYLG